MDILVLFGRGLDLRMPVFTRLAEWRPRDSVRRVAYKANILAMRGVKTDERASKTCGHSLLWGFGQDGQGRTIGHMRWRA